jgi:hypothetical protein
MMSLLTTERTGSQPDDLAPSLPISAQFTSGRKPRLVLSWSLRAGTNTTGPSARSKQNIFCIESMMYPCETRKRTIHENQSGLAGAQESCDIVLKLLDEDTVAVIQHVATSCFTKGVSSQLASHDTSKALDPLRSKAIYSPKVSPFA